MLTIQLSLNRAEAEALAAILARIVLDEEEPPPAREIAGKVLEQIERTRVSESIISRKRR